MLSEKWSKDSLFFLFSVACIGTLLRFFSYVNIPFEYQHLVHAHSHVAFQGWIYTIMFLLLVNLFIDKNKIQNRNYKRQLIITVFVIVGVLFSFSVQGYGLYSIVFSSLFQVLNYWFIYCFFQDSISTASSISLRFVKTGLLLGVLSTIAPWGVGVLSAKGLKGTEIFDATIYFFLHFQYNGWFLFVFIGVFFKVLEKHNIVFSSKKATKFYVLFALAVLPAYTLSLLGMSFGRLVFYPALLAGCIQLVGLFYFLQLVKDSILQGGFDKNKWAKTFLYLSIVCFSVKVILQLMSAIPLFESYAFGSKNLVLAAGPFCSDLADKLGISLPLKNYLQHKFLIPDPENAIPKDMPFTIFADGQILNWNDDERSLLSESPEFAHLLDAFPAGLHIKPEGNNHIKMGWAYNRQAAQAHWQPQIKSEFVDIVMRGASRFIPSLAPYIDKLPTPLTQYSGYYTRTQDNLPLIGPTQVDGVFVVSGLSGFGTMSACAAGELIANIMSKDTLPQYAKYFSPDRYNNAELMSEISRIDNDGQL